MNDLIGRQEAIDMFDGAKVDEGYCTEYEIGYNDGIDFAVSKISVLASAQRWIPVSEGLPKKNGRYFVTRGLNACGTLWNRVYIINYSDLMGLKSEKIWWQGNVGKSDFEQITDVVAWMPLPEPWKGDDVKKVTDEVVKEIKKLPSAQSEWNNHTVACMLAELFNDTCACNYNDIGEWLPLKCELLDSCPHPAGVACWEQYLTHRAERRRR